MFNSVDPVNRFCQQTDIHQTILSIQDIKDWMTNNKLQLNKDKTEALLFSSSKLQDPPTCPCARLQSLSLIPSETSVSGLDKDLSTKEHIGFICKIAFFELSCISTIQHYLSVDSITFVVSLVLSLNNCCDSLLAGLPQSLISKLQCT